MAKNITKPLLIIFLLLFLGCGGNGEKPLTGADFVSVIVANHYRVEPVRIDAVENGYEWHLRAENASDYAWKGTLVLKLVTTEDRILETHEFPMDRMVEPGETHEDLTFLSEYDIADRGGPVRKIKVEVNATDYIEPEAETE
jgi:hypothetical protein